MKKIIVILIALLYLLGLTQLSVSFHHCGKQLKYVQINHSEEKVCCGKKGNKKHCCCEDLEVKYNVDDQTLAKIASISVKIFQSPDVHFNTAFLPSSIAYKVDEVFKITHPPPLYGALRTHILNCVFLI